MKVTPLHDLHRRIGGRMVEYAGYSLPVRYQAGLAAEHLHTRRAASLFDVSHMGVIVVSGEQAAVGLEALMPQDVAGLAAGRQRYGFLTNDTGGIIDDLIISNDGNSYTLVVNAATKGTDVAYLRRRLADLTVCLEDDVSILALQGPYSAAALGRHVPSAADLAFMSRRVAEFDGVEVTIARSGYTGEDGFEIMVAAEDATLVAEALLGTPQVRPAGLGARDSLRLEAGLCLYGHDLDTTTTPVEAGLMWAVAKRRRVDGGFPGDSVIRSQADEGPSRRRIGLAPLGKAPVRAGAVLHGPDDEEAGQVTSGTVSPTLQRPIAMGYITSHLATPGTELTATARGRQTRCAVAAMPFVPHRYHTDAVL